MQVNPGTSKRAAVLRALARHRSSLIVIGLLTILSGAIGATVGIWLDRIDFYARLLRKIERTIPIPDSKASSWENVSSLYEQLQIATIRVSTVTVNGGSMAVLGDNILFASPQGNFSYLDAHYQLRDLPIKTRMNIEGLRNDPLYNNPRFQVASLTPK